METPVLASLRYQTISGMPDLPSRGIQFTPENLVHMRN